MNSCDLIDFIYSFAKAPRNIIYIINCNVQKLGFFFSILQTCPFRYHWFNNKIKWKKNLLKTALTNTDVLHSPCLFENKAIAS